MIYRCVFMLLVGAVLFSMACKVFIYMLNNWKYYSWLEIIVDTAYVTIFVAITIFIVIIVCYAWLKGYFPWEIVEPLIL